MALDSYLHFIGLKNTYPACDVPGYCADRKNVSKLINNDYLETLTQLYCENHLEVLELMSRKYGKTLRYRVAYNKPFEIERFWYESTEGYMIGLVEIQEDEMIVLALVHKRRNQLKIVASSNLYNRVFTADIGSELLGLVYLPRDYGIRESENKKIRLKLEYQ